MSEPEKTEKCEKLSKRIQNAHGAKRPALIIESFIEIILFNSRWLLAPLYLGMVVALMILTVKFGQELWHIIPVTLTASGSDIILATLSLIDIALITNLLLMIIFSGYENFVSKIDLVEDHVDRPSWMGKIDYTAMKLKVIGSIVAISSIELLKAFINIHNMPKEDIILMMAIHLTFVISGVLYAWMEKIYYSVDKH
jgi:uncharacterized protein (TIGR00645 family)